MKNTAGQPVRGDDFFDREPEQRTLWDSLDADNILLLAPRRVGKTSLMRRLEETAEQRGFRALYLTVEGATDEPTFVRRLLAGSIGLDTVAARLNLGDTINDLRMQGLGPFDSETADRFLLELSKSYPIDLAPQIREHIVERIAWPIPYYLQVVFAELREMNAAAPIDRSRVDEAFARLLDPARKNYFDYWRQRLHDELGTPEDGWALTLLNSICRDPEGASYETFQQALGRRISDPDERDSHLRYLLDVLQNDGYLVDDGDRYRFRLPLLREYWLRRVAR